MEEIEMKATEILSKKLKVDSKFYGCNAFQIVDFEIAGNGNLRLFYDSHYNDETYIYDITLSAEDVERMLNGEVVEIVGCALITLID